MTLNEKITEIKREGWEYEIFTTASNTLCVQAWVWAREMREWEFTLDGSKQIGEENQVIAF